MIPRKHHAAEENVDSWLMSYADMITLLLCFFIIYVSTSEPRQDRFAAATKGFHQQFGTIHLDSPYDGIYRDILGTVASHNADQNISVEKTPKGIRIELSALHYFAPDSTEIDRDQLPMLISLATSLKKINLGERYTITVEGHTDNQPANAQIYASNWELAGLRASRIVRFLSEQGIPANHLRAVSFADTKPAVPNEDAAGHAIVENQARNNRVVIRLEQGGE